MNHKRRRGGAAAGVATGFGVCVCEASTFSSTWRQVGGRLVCWKFQPVHQCNVTRPV